MSKKLTLESTAPKTLQGPSPLTMDISIDELLKRALRSIYGLMAVIETDISLGIPSRNTVMNLRDANMMLWEYKKKEKEFLDSATDEQLEKLLKK